MAYFHDTNIDKEFKDSVTSKRNGKKSIIFIAVFLLLVIIVGFILFFTFRDNGYSIMLEGDSEISIYQGREYVEFGYHGYNKKGEDVTDRVEVSGNVDISTVGEYTIIYSVGDVKVVRVVKVIDKGVGDTYLHLKGDLTIYLKVGESYVEPGYSVIDTVDGNLSDKVSVDGNVNTSKAGTYKLVYSVVNSAGVTTSGTRTVIVLGSEMSLTLSNSSKTTGPININVYVNDNYFDYLVLPNGKKVSENKYSYQVSSNGTYKFVAYNTRGEKIEKSITVSNIVVDTGNNNSGSGTGSVNTPKVYTSDNIGSGNKHSVGFLLKLTTDSSVIYYCTDSANTCSPNTKYTGQIRFATSGQKYLRYKACNSSNQCSNIGSYKINLVIENKNPSVSTSGGIANPYQAAYYYQADSRWANYYVYGSYKMRQVGCGFNAFSMIVTGITHNYKYTPDEVYNTLKQIKKETGVVFQDSYTGGGLLDTAVVDKNVAKHFGYDVNVLWKYKFGASKDSSSLIAEKKEKILESLKMGHMILLRVPNHFIALVGIKEDNQIYVFDSGGTGAHLNDIDGIFEDYYYRVSTSYGTECNIALGYEIYPAGGISWDNWKKIK